jgi:cell division protein FtsZ
LGDAIRVTVVATGLVSQQAARVPLRVLETVRRTGTDNLPIHNVASTTSTTGTTGLGGGQAARGPDTLTVPSVWRTNRTQASDKVNALSAGGMDDFEIPAFLRRQVD